MKTALTIAGSDSSGGAGIQADLKTMTMLGVYAMSAIAALTAQNTTGVSEILEVSPHFLEAQLDSIFTDIFPDAVKIGMLSSASLNETKFGLYEPSHGSAPDIAGQNKANPIATILSAAMLLRYSLNLDEEADAVEAAVQKVLTDGYRTGDIMSEGCKKVGTKEMGDLIAAAV